jgi:hypothetical protein
VKAKTKKKIKSTKKTTATNDSQSKPIPSDSDDDLVRKTSSLSSSPAPCYQGKWIHRQNYHAWDPVYGHKITGKVKHRWENMETDDITYERPGSFQSDKSFFYTSCDDIGGHESDEYDDVYTNVSAIRENPVMSAPPPAFGPARTKMFSTAQLARRKNQFRPQYSGKSPTRSHSPWCRLVFVGRRGQLTP